MRRLVAIAWLAATVAVGQSPLDADLDRALERRPPAATRGSSEVDRLVAVAAEHFRGGRSEPAVAALDQAAGVAYTSGATGWAFELSLTAAEAQRSAGEWLDAARRFRDAALSNTRDPRAAVAHLAACDAFALWLPNATEQELDEYNALLTQHATTWPQAASARSTEWRRTELLAQRKRWRELLDRLRPIPDTDPRREAKQRLLVAAYAASLRESSDELAAALPDLEAVILGTPRSWPGEWSVSQRDAAMVLSRHALAQADSLDYARLMLRKAVRDAPSPPAEWRLRAVSLLVVAALAADDSRAASQWMSSFEEIDPDARQRLFESTREHVRAKPESLPQEADRLLASTRALAGDTRVSTGQRAAALADTGQDTAARQLYERLAAERPNDRGTQIAYAELLGAGTLPADHEAALAIWRKLEARSERATDAWFASRLGRLRMLVALGREEEATKLLRLTRLLAPSLGGAERAAEFAAVGETLRP